MLLGRDSLALASLTSSLLNRCASSSEQHPMPPRSPLCGLLSLSRSGAGLTNPTLLLLGRLRGFWDLSEAVQFSTQVVALPFCLFASAALLVHPLVQRGLRHF